MLPKKGRMAYILAEDDLEFPPLSTFSTVVNAFMSSGHQGMPTKSENVNVILKDDSGENVEVKVSPIRNIDDQKAWEFLIANSGQEKTLDEIFV